MPLTTSTNSGSDIYKKLSWKVNLVQTTAPESVTMNRDCWWQSILPVNSNHDLPFSLHSYTFTRPRHTHTGCTAKGGLPRSNKIVTVIVSSSHPVLKAQGNSWLIRIPTTCLQIYSYVPYQKITHKCTLS